MKETRLLRSFNAKGDRGQQYVIHEFQDFERTQTYSGVSEPPGLKSLRLADGRRVNYIDKGKYQIVTSGETLTSDDPKAP